MTTEQPTPLLALLPLVRPSVQHAHETIKQYIYETPVLTNTTLSNLASTPQSPEALKGTPWEGQEPAKPKFKLFFKCENFQRIGAFKVRGAFHAVCRLSGAQRERGLVTNSSGEYPMPILSNCKLSTIWECLYFLHDKNVHG